MTKETEEGFLQAVMAFAKLNGWRSAHFRPAKTAKGWRTAVGGEGKGFPDLVMIHPALQKMVVAELKVGRNTTTHDQDVWLDHFKEVCDDVYVWRPTDWPTIQKVLSG